MNRPLPQRLIAWAAQAPTMGMRIILYRLTRADPSLLTAALGRYEEEQINAGENASQPPYISLVHSESTRREI